MAVLRLRRGRKVRIYSDIAINVLTLKYNYFILLHKKRKLKGRGMDWNQLRALYRR